MAGTLHPEQLWGQSPAQKVWGDIFLGTFCIWSWVHPKSVVKRRIKPQPCRLSFV